MRPDGTYMKDLKLDDVRLVLANPHGNVRNSLRMALNDAGIRNNNVFDGGEVDIVSEAMQGRLGPDIIICDTSLRGGDILRMLQAIRHNEFGPNPFLGIIAIGWDTTFETVNSVMETGADFFLAAPISPQQILDRIGWLVHNRKPFVVTTEYVGPDRRKSQRALEEGEIIDAPNTLRAKAMGQFDADVMEREVKAAIVRMNDHKALSHAFRLARSAEQVAIDSAQSMAPPPGHRLKLLDNSASELKKHCLGTGLDHIGKLCSAVQSVLAKLAEVDRTDLLRDIEILQQLSFAIRAAVNPEEKSSTLAHDIAAAVTTDG